MADVTLRSTLKKIDALIDGGRYEEAKANTRHVLTQYPKNAHAYFALARVLVAQRQWEEAGEVLRRLLGATPLDAQAHQLLSVVYQNTNQPENALYHLERAFDQQPNDRNIINQLRELYGRYRNTAVEKIQLTAGAVAGQYLNNNLPDQAIDILTKALRRFPDRADLKLMLARAYRIAEQPVDAAETAMDALKTLPYAVPANELLAEFWLEQGRPSDARAYITRIEEVDPYLALKLATGQDDEQRYTLPELDYRRVAERELSAANPDWLSDLQPGEAADDLSWLTDDPAPASAPRKKVTDNLPDLLDDLPASGGGSETIPVDENFTGEISPEVLRRLEAIKGIANDGTIVTDARPAERPRDDLNNLLDEIDPAPHRRTGFTGLLGALDTQSAKEPEVDEDSWLLEIINASDEEPPAGEVAPEDSGLMSLDFLSDLDPRAPISPQSGRMSTGFTDRIEADAPTPAEEPLAEQAYEFDDAAFRFDAAGFEEETEGDTDALPEPRASFFDSLEFVEDEAPAAPALPSARGGDDLPASDAADPLAWMRDAGIEYDESAENPFEAMRSLDDADPISPQQVAQDPLAWARDTGGVEIDLEAIATEEAEKPSTDPLAWMKGLDIEIEEPTPPPGDQDRLKDLLQMEVLSTDELNSYIDPASQGDWQDAMTDNANWQDDDLEGFEWLSDDSTDMPDPNPQAEDAPAGDLDWMSEQESSFDWEQESNPQAEAATGFTGMLDNLGAMYGSTEDDPLAWMNRYKTDYLDEAMLGADPTAPQAQHASEAQPAASDMSEDKQPAEVPDFFASADDDQSAEVPDFFATTDDSLDFIEEAVATEGADFTENYEMADDAGAFDFTAQNADDDIPPPETLHEPPVGFTDFDEVLAGSPPADDDFDFEAMSAEAAAGDFDFDMSPEAPADDFSFTQEPADEMADFDFDMSPEAPADDFSFAQEPADEMADFDFDMSPEAPADDFSFTQEPADEMPDFDFDMSPEAPAEEPGDWMPDLGTATSMDAQTSLDDVDFGEYAAPEENISFGFDTAAFEAFEGEQEAVEAPPPAARRQPGDEFSFVDELLEGETSDEQEEFFLDEFALEQELAGDGFGQEFSMEQGSEEYSDEFNLDEFQLSEEDELAAADLSEFDFGEAQEPGAEAAADYSFEETNEPDWLGHIDGSSVSAIATEEPDWLAAVGAAPVESSESGDAYDEAYASDNYTEANADDFDFAQEPAAEMTSDFDFDMSAEADELADEPLASNIPDWLNTMAPGLDINYENLPSDDVIEEAFEEGATYRERSALDEFTAVNDGYEWLTDIVEEESQNVAPVNPTAAPPPLPLAPLPDFSRAGSEAPAEAPAPRSRARFVFDRLPPWVLKLRGVTQRPPEPVAAADDDDEFADFDFDDDDLK